MKEKEKDTLAALEKLAQETKEHAKVFDQIDKSLLRPYSIQKLGSSFAEQYPALSEFAALKDALKTEPFQFGGEKLKEAFERLCAENGVVFLDLTEKNIAAALDGLLPFGFANTTPGTGHINRLGLRIFAEGVYEQLAKGVD